MKAVFDTKPNSGYDDEIVRRYHFPTQSNYLAAAEAAVGDWIVYREPQRNRGRRAYIAVARVLGIEPDPRRPNHTYAIIGDYLPFDRPVPFAGDPNGADGGGGYWEAPLRAVENASRVGATLQGKAMRPLADADFSAIVTAGLAETLAPQNAIRLGLTDLAAGMAETAQPFDHGDATPGLDQVRRVEQLLRKIRDANFRRQVCEAYDDRCAVTGAPRGVYGGVRGSALRQSGSSSCARSGRSPMTAFRDRAQASPCGGCPAKEAIWTLHVPDSGRRQRLCESAAGLSRRQTLSARTHPTLDLMAAPLPAGLGGSRTGASRPPSGAHPCASLTRRDR
jgi:hypothetical protein